MLLRVSLPVSLRRVVDRAPPPPADVGAAAPAPPPHSTPAPGSARSGTQGRRALRGAALRPSTWIGLHRLPQRKDPQRHKARGLQAAFRAQRRDRKSVV